MNYRHHNLRWIQWLSETHEKHTSCTHCTCYITKLIILSSSPNMVVYASLLIKRWDVKLLLPTLCYSGIECSLLPNFIVVVFASSGCVGLRSVRYWCLHHNSYLAASLIASYMNIHFVYVHACQDVYLRACRLLQFLAVIYICEL